MTATDVKVRAVDAARLALGIPDGTQDYGLTVIACSPTGDVALHYRELPRGLSLLVRGGTGDLSRERVWLTCDFCGRDLGAFDERSELTAILAAPHVCPQPEDMSRNVVHVAQYSDAPLPSLPGRWLAEGSPEYRLLSAVEDMIADAARRSRE